jgi:hypothetical protein
MDTKKPYSSLSYRVLVLSHSLFEVCYCLNPRCYSDPFFTSKSHITAISEEVLKHCDMQCLVVTPRHIDVVVHLDTYQETSPVGLELGTQLKDESTDNSCGPVFTRLA